ncbi:kinase-like protein [Rhizophagus irregularis]|uniref:Kinase-like protein n=1 Tax=Rhizophagus irregularis TaxID=588596 RepID=A0A2N0QBK3_9GLOM|nr:kinase-like protein [Rhizophagus irregularis]
MEIVNANDENSFDPTPRLKSSPIPIKFISFNVLDENCIYCGEKYIKALFCFWQKYCKKCLSRYINDITENDIYLDVHYTMDLECSEHEISRTKIPQSIQECCGNCVRILCYKQTNGYISELGLDENDLTLYNKVIESEKNCKLCGKSIYQGIYEWYISVKLCSDCYLISSGLIESTLVKKKISILYLPWWHNNCRCNVCNSELTFTSDCQKYCANCLIFYVGCRYCLTTNILFGPTDQSQCKKCKRISLINSGFDDFIFNNNFITYDDFYYLKLAEFENIVKKINEYFVPYDILEFIIKKKKQPKQNNKWIPYSQFKDVKEMTKGGYGIIYKATWSSKNKTVILKRFENSKNNGKYFLNELKSYYHCFKDKKGHIIETYGFTKDPELEDYIIVMEYASGGDLHKHLQKDFAGITWNREKLRILHQISVGLETIHNKKFMHRDFHSGNILFDPKNKRTLNDDWKIGDLGLSQAVNSESSNNEIGPEFAEKRHLEAIYTSRPLSALISKCSSIYSLPKISFDKRDSSYISELEINTDVESLSLYELNSTIQNYSTALDSRYISAELELDINTESLSSQNLSSTLQPL